MDKFIIDKQFGQAIWIDVVKGVVKRCYNEAPKFNKSMNEIYRGKSISFLKANFETRMKPSYHNVRPEAILISLQKISAVKSRIKANWKRISGLGIIYHGKDAENQQATQKAEQDRLKAKIDEYVIEQSNYEKELQTEKHRLLQEHNYNV